MMPHRRIVMTTCVLVVVTVGLSSAWAFVVTDPATTARNAVTAVLTRQIVDTIVQQHDQLCRMAQRLSAHTSLEKYIVPEPPRWHPHASNPETVPYGHGYLGALTYGDPTGAQFAYVSRSRMPVDDTVSRLSPDARDSIERALATLDVADSTIIAATHQTGLLRANGRRELEAIDELERHITDPSPDHSATAILDTISGAALMEARQKQARLQLLTAVVEQLLIDNKRSRDTEAAVLNMRLQQLRAPGDEGGGFMTGASEDLRTWRQP
jgi:conjugal transfer/entry exclusion protein